jgi:hypothetical protein
MPSEMFFRHYSLLRLAGQRIIENITEGGLRFLSMTNLDIKATEIELAFVREQKKALLH